MERAVVLLSGGIDSTTLLHVLRRRRGVRDVHALSFLYGQKHSGELEMAEWQARSAGAVSHRVVDISFFGRLTGPASALTGEQIDVPDLSDLDGKQLGQPPTYVPNRNMALLSLAAAYAEARQVQDVFYGAQAQDRYGYWDCTTEFVERLNAALALNRRTPVRVHAPFVGMAKSEVLKIGLELDVDYGHTWTCYRGGERPCGACPSCQERANAFREAGVTDPLLTQRISS